MKYQVKVLRIVLQFGRLENLTLLDSMRGIFVRSNNEVSAESEPVCIPES